MGENKTAMQELLEWTRRTLPMDLDTPRMIEEKIESLLVKEREQIEDAYNYGYLDYQILAHDDAVQYYDVNYGKPTPKPFA
jgi:hypothetical protein